MAITTLFVWMTSEYRLVQWRGAIIMRAVGLANGAPAADDAPPHALTAIQPRL